MTLRTVTYDDSTHKIVPIEPEESQINQGCLSQDNFIHASYEDWANSYPSGISQQIRELIIKDYKHMVTAAPEYQDSERNPVAIGEVNHD